MEECLDVDSLASTFNDACVATNLLHNDTAYENAQKGLETCCGSDNVFTVGYCYTYCNITTPYDTVMIDACLQDTLDADTSFSLNFDCFPLAWELSSTMDTSAGRIATTWTFPDQTVTVTETDGSVQTETFDSAGNLISTTAKTTSSAISATARITSPTATQTSTQASSTMSSSSIVTPTSSKSGGPGFKPCYKTKIFMALSVLLLVL